MKKVMKANRRASANARGNRSKPLQVPATAPAKPCASDLVFRFRDVSHRVMDTDLYQKVVDGKPQFYLGSQALATVTDFTWGEQLAFMIRPVSEGEALLWYRAGCAISKDRLGDVTSLFAAPQQLYEEATAWEKAITGKITMNRKVAQRFDVVCRRENIDPQLLLDAAVDHIVTAMKDDSAVRDAFNARCRGNGYPPPPSLSNGHTPRAAKKGATP